MSDDFFAPPPFKADEALQRARRELRELGLTEREGRFERKGQAIAKLALDGATLKAAIVKRPGRSPEWSEKTLRDAAALRDFVAELKKKLAGWSDRDE
jgi:HrpA-like RNA helicase